MKIICAGFWKTGTKSLAEALRILGYKVYDFDDQYLELGDLWDKFFSGTVTNDDIRQELKDVDVIIDGTAIAFWEEIYKAIPDCKIILTMRDEDSWFQSMSGVMYENTPLHQKLSFAAMAITPAGHHFMSSMLSVIEFSLGMKSPFTISTANKRLYKLQFRKHNCHVLHSVPEDKLLIFEATDGWSPLCKFLGEEIPPDVPYPHRNKLGAHMRSEGGPKNPKFHKIVRNSLITVAIYLVILIYMIYYILVVYFL